MARSISRPKGRRGRPRLPEEDRRSRNFTFRGRAELHSNLAEAAKTSRRSISEEIEHRLERSFADDRTIEAALGGQEIYDILRIVAATLHAAGNTSAAEGGRLIDDPVRYDRAVKAVNHVLEALRPNREAYLKDYLAIVGKEIEDRVRSGADPHSMARNAMDQLLQAIDEGERQPRPTERPANLQNVTEDK
jgi:hypothetical protein